MLQKGMTKRKKPRFMSPEERKKHRAARSRRSYRKNRQKILEKARKRAEKGYPQRLFREFGLLESDYEQLKERSGQKCEICGSPPAGKRLAVDHDHVTGGVRGLLCARCNTALTELFCDPIWRKKALEYLSRPQIKTMRSLLRQSEENGEKRA